MLFCSSAFLLFFLVVFGAYWSLPWPRARVWLLVAASLYFYASWDKRLALVILASTTFDYFVARGIDWTASPRKRRLLAALSVTANLGLLCYFKYMNFFLASLEQSLRLASASVSFPLLSVILPIGVSFYTFEAINYVVDVCTGRVKAERNYANFLLFILFFRTSWLVQSSGRAIFCRRCGAASAGTGCEHRSVCACSLWVSSRSSSSRTVWRCTSSRSFRTRTPTVPRLPGWRSSPIRCKSTATSPATPTWPSASRICWATGCCATSTCRSWRRTCRSSGGAGTSRCRVGYATICSFRSAAVAAVAGALGRNLLITMTLGGLWHGANWTFVVWGLLHGSLLIGHRLFQQACEGRERLRRGLESVPGTVVRIALTFLCVSVCWVFFRAPTFAAALTILRALVVAHPGKGEPVPALGLVLTMAVLLGAWVGQRNGLWRRASELLPATALGMTDAGLLATCLLLAPPWGQPFIYFQF